MRLGRLSIAVALLAGLFAFSDAARSTDAQLVEIAVQNGGFQSQEVHASADVPITLVIRNLDSAPMQFSSAMLRAFALLSPNSTRTLQVRALPHGRYTFFDESTPGAHGVLILD
jgi:hypothetical protein